jgi:Protein of unknown function (DUF3027)
VADTSEPGALAIRATRPVSCHLSILPYGAVDSGWENGAVSPVPSVKPDPICTAAIEIAEAAARDVGGAGVGEHLGVRTEAERVVTHRFAARLPGYAGWYWAVTVARASRAKFATVDEVVLLPGKGALLPPEWVPWSERLRPGDLAPGDVLPTPADDARLEPGFLASGDEWTDAPAVAAVATDLFLGRPRVLSPYGRAEATDRWVDGAYGPNAPMAATAPARCATCGFLIPLPGALRGAFGVCANEYAPADGQVVTVDYGCGAHSEAVAHGGQWPAADSGAYDDVEMEATGVPSGAVAQD